CGSPNIGGFINAEMTGNSSTGIPVLGFDLSATPQNLLGCNVVHTFSIAQWFATTSTVQIPLSTTLGGLIIGVQGADLLPGGGGGCGLGLANLTDGYQVTVNM
ncbi:MAG: hypothetical protein KDC98_19640, partial [Planctomycetes bacterium]|nr:hypothetical protein [Planctomycetota bacterium]